MKKIQSFYFIQFLVILFALTSQSCASKRDPVIIDKEAVSKKYDYNLYDNNVLYIVDGKEVNADDIKKIPTQNIDSVTVIKGEKDVAMYTDKKYDGVIIIKMKK